ncbi:ATP-dependent RNA helicase RhlB [Treponema bryantii]|uniref:ATP-dependent RNA helicase RhlB n=1 Tax=Treponema bryantii TaxID=163 RepID=A0A1H9AI41_9SPIR|nr:DEAD/DEAH box helicase [Treponema bryantii]SEP76275.1 ATP-dependent RNA helicase RhlB [Treponema bryantii]
MDFTEFGLDERLLKGIEAAGYVTCTPVQEQVIKASKAAEGTKGPDLYVQSQTGTGKTCAYLVAVIGEMVKAENAGKKCLILAPTRELAVQIEEEAKVLVGTSGLKAFSVYGGVGYEKQIATLKKGVDIVIGTPGRVIDLNEGGNLDLSNSHFCVIDEADRMFDMGFYDDLRKILKKLPEAETRQTMLFSATLNTYVKNLAWEYTRDPVEITIEAENITVSEIQQELLHVSSDEKMKLLVGILKHENPESAIIFCNTKRSCEVIAKRLVINEIQAEFMIGDLPQSKRLAILKKFKAGEIKILVATDVAARGIDVDDLAMVINYDLPVEAENYVHRIGRTARAGKSGKAYTFCSEQDVYNLPAIERYIEMSIPATVAYPDQMEEDKSAGMYIKTENWRGDDDYDNRGGYRKGKDGDIHNRRRDDRDGRGHGKRNGHGRDDKRDDRRHDGYKKDGYKKGGKGRDFEKRGKKPYIDPAKLAGLSYEERMKMYKDAYASGSVSKGAKDIYKKGGYKKGDYKKGDYKKNGKKPYNKSYNNNRPQQKAAPEKKSFWQKVKSFFGR